MILDQTRLDLHLLLRLQMLYNVADHLVCDRIHMGPTLRGPDAIDKGHAELLVHWAIGYGNVPALIWRLIDHCLASKRLGILC